MNDNLYNEGHPVQVWVDYTDFNIIKKVYPHKKQVKTDPGVTLTELNQELQPYGLYVPYVISELFDKDRSQQLDQVIQENRICLQSLKYGFFKDSCVERISFISGEAL